MNQKQQALREREILEKELATSGGIGVKNVRISNKSLDFLANTSQLTEHSRPTPKKRDAERREKSTNKAPLNTNVKGSMPSRYTGNKNESRSGRDAREPQAHPFPNLQSLATGDTMEHVTTSATATQQQHPKTRSSRTGTRDMKKDKKNPFAVWPPRQHEARERESERENAYTSNRYKLNKSTSESALINPLTGSKFKEALSSLKEAVVADWNSKDGARNEFEAAVNQVE